MRGRTGTGGLREKKKEIERTEGVRRGVGRNLINLFIKRFSCLCWGCRVPTGNTRRLNEYRRRRRRLNSAARGIHREEVRVGSGTDTLFLMESTWSTGGHHQRFRIQRSSPCGNRARARDSSNFVGGTLSHRRSRGAQTELLRIRAGARKDTERQEKKSERPILLSGGDSGSPLTQSNRRGSLNNRFASSSSEELQPPRPKKKKKTISSERGSAAKEDERTTLDAARPEIHSFPRIPFYARILSVISQPGLN